MVAETGQALCPNQSLYFKKYARNLFDKILSGLHTHKNMQKYTRVSRNMYTYITCSNSSHFSDKKFFMIVQSYERDNVSLSLNMYFWYFVVSDMIFMLLSQDSNKNRM